MSRGKLNRLVSTWGYSKSVDMLSGSLATVWMREGLIQCQRVQ